MPSPVAPAAAWQWLRLRLFPDSAFATALRGDTLFGQLCWYLRESLGEAGLNDLLAGYHDQRPFAVISDPMLADHLPRPHLPEHLLGFAAADARARKQRKQQCWLPLAFAHQPLAEWGAHVTAAPERHRHRSDVQMHNSINRQTLTTGGDDAFAPFGSEQHWFDVDTAWDLYLLHDERLSAAQLTDALRAIGLLGYGKDASIGKGRFHLTPQPMPELPTPDGNPLRLTLAPCAPQQGHWHSADSFFSPLVRVGRHGAALVVQGHPFKNPLLLADSAAVLAPVTPDNRPFVGQGVGGNGRLSTALPQTVHQGYAPVIPVRFHHKAQPQ
ncbi:hypothetical protein IG605_004300 [Pectobacterium quasiaquaticum]|nr:hypothetical protein IG605_004300 [Pectobacterium quasiaquaticum]